MMEMALWRIRKFKMHRTGNLLCTCAVCKRLLKLLFINLFLISIFLFHVKKISCEISLLNDINY
jgi:hypothetical protein